MKVLRYIVIVLFSLIILLPVFFFNFTTDSLSEIDNRQLSENPFLAKGDLTENIENYVNDRIGFRDQFITAYTVWNDKLFGKMVHPLYTYGKDGYVFGAGVFVSNDFGDYHILYADMVQSIQAYCESRGVPFLFVFNPAKPALYQDKIADGINYDREWVELFFAELDKRNINYLDNTVTMREHIDSGEECFNQKYDANHWNDMGAFYGTNAILEKLKDIYPQVHINTLSEFNISEKHMDSLPVSKFPIDEDVPDLSLKCTFENISDHYSAINLNPSFRSFGYYTNETRKQSFALKALVFQGSNMNNFGYKYLINSFSEYIHIHDYQNVIDFPYYFNIFQPDCVIFEVAEYTFLNKYFDSDAMKNINYNPLLTEADCYAAKISQDDLTIEQNGNLTVITWHTDDIYKYVWAKLSSVYDMKATSDGYQFTFDSSLDSFNGNILIYVSD